MAMGAQKMVNQLMEKEGRSNRRRIERVLLIQQANRKLMEGQEMNIQQCRSMFNAEQPLQPLTERIRRDDNGERSQRIGSFELSDILDNGHLQIRMEGPGNNL